MSSFICFRLMAGGDGGCLMGEAAECGSRFIDLRIAGVTERNEEKRRLELRRRRRRRRRWDGARDVEIDRETERRTERRRGRKLPKVIRQPAQNCWVSAINRHHRTGRAVTWRAETSNFQPRSLRLADGALTVLSLSILILSLPFGPFLLLCSVSLSLALPISHFG